MRVKWCVLVILPLTCFHGSISIEDPYSTLGIHRRASGSEIKKAYKNLARQWHPDKNKSPGAQDKFVEINEAYEILTNAERKEQYDHFGTFDEPRRQQGHQFFQGGDFFGGDFPNFRFERSSDAFDKNRITHRMYRASMISKSWKKPYLLFIYSDWCMSCFQYEPMWENIMNDLEPIGFGVGSVNNMMEGALVKELRVQRLPSIVAIIEGRPVHFSASFSHKDVIKFARQALPQRLIVPVNDHTISSFLDSWKMNKVSVLILAPLDKPRIRFLIAAMETQPFTRFGYVQIGNQDQDLRKVIRLTQPTYETVLIFNEKPENGPVASLSTKQLSRDSILNLIQNNKFLTLPRISSQEYFDDLCPVSKIVTGPKSDLNRELCLVLIVSDTKSDSVYIETMRDFAEEKVEGGYDKDRVQFTYIFANKQEKFLEALANQISIDTESESRDLVIVWRTEQNKAKYSWLKGMWDARENKINESSKELTQSLSMVLSGKTTLTHFAALNSLVDEHGPGWFARFSGGVHRLWDTVTFHAAKDELLPAVSVFATLLFIFIIGYGLNYVVSLEQDSELRKKKMKAQREGKKVDSVSETGRMMRELRAETYFGMVRLLKPGCRTIIVLVDEATKNTLLQRFSKAVAPWRNNKTLMFGFVSVDKNLDWFRTMLQHTLGAQVTDGPNLNDPEDISTAPASLKLKSINPKQVVGTVLALNGWRLYFNMYHPMHAPSMAPGQKSANNDFLGMNADSLDSDESPDSDAEHGLHHRRRTRTKGNERLKTDHLLDGLSNWLDRLFEGSIRRYYIPEWPPIK